MLSSILSPDAHLRLSFEIRDHVLDDPHREGEKQALFFELQRDGIPVLRTSRLGLLPAGDAALIEHFELESECRKTGGETWNPVCGEWSEIVDQHVEWTLDLRETIAPHRRLRIVFRLSNAGLAFRYAIDNVEGWKRPIVLEREETWLAFPEGTMAWETPVAQAKYRKVPLQDLISKCERPLTLELPSGLFVGLAEAAMVAHPRSKFSATLHRPSALIRPTRPMVGLDPDSTCRIDQVPWASSWRVVFVAERAVDLLRHTHWLMSLCPTCELEDTSWIRPGKCIREITLSTDGAVRCIDFAVANGLQHIEFDAGWYGHEYDDGADARSVSIDPRRLSPGHGGLDLHQVIAYGKERGIGVFLYVNRRHLERQLNELAPLYQSWGVAGIKFGFVQEGPQEWTMWLHEAVRLCGRHQLMVDIHDEYRPTGLSRTWPHLLTQEGIHGNEAMPTAEHNVTLPFTRFLAGAADYTICHRFPRMELRLKTTPGHQMAMAAVYFSPLQFLFWYGTPEENEGLPELEWYRTVPTVWDETLPLAGEIGEFVVMARRSGEAWFVGVMTNSLPRTVQVAFSFLKSGDLCRARIFSDSERATPGQPTSVSVEDVEVNSQSVLTVELPGSGGVAIWIQPKV
ncbi:MAG: glycoside hydrolase family 97 catalytic domain-containing protein [Verrucomicrobiales bacterium]